MPVVTCECGKKLNAPAAAAGKKVRCPGCKGVVAVPAEEEAAAAPPPAAPKAAPKPVPKPVLKPEPEDDEVAEAAPPPKWKRKKAEPKEDEERDENDESEAVEGLRCAKCKAAAVKKLPPDEFSRKPGYVCMKCKTTMRPPGSKGGLYAAVGLGILIAVLGLGLVFVAFSAEKNRVQLFSGAGTMCVVGLGVAAWAMTQSKLPVPLGAKAPPSRMGLLIAIILIGLLLAGGLVFGIMYVIHEEL
jgi:hypothetical protein